MAKGIIPDKLHDFNVYSNANKLIGISGEVKLPELAAMSETLSGPGIMGEIDSPTPGFFSGMEQEIPFRTLYEDMFSLMSPLDAVDINLRGAIQTIDTIIMKAIFYLLRLQPAASFFYGVAVFYPVHGKHD